MNKHIQLVAYSLLVATAAQAAQQQRTPPPPPPLPKEQSAAPSQAESMMQRLQKPQKRDLATALRLMNGQTIAHVQSAPQQQPVNSKQLVLKAALYRMYSKGASAQPNQESKKEGASS